MILIRILRFLKGYVCFTCTGGFAERFINLCSLNGIVLWDTKTLPDGIEAKTYIKCLSRITEAEEKSGMKMQIKSQNGFPVIISPYLERKGLIAGAISAILLVIWLSGFLWTTEIKGNVNYTGEQILEICRNYGVYQGARLNDIDVYEVKNAIETASDDFGWFAINIYGSGASVELTERLAKTEIHDKTTPCNIISDTDGEVIEIYSLSGEPQVKIGSAVKKGDLIISGITQRLNGSVAFVHAMGHAVIRTSEHIEAAVSRNTEILRTEKFSTGYSIGIFFLKIPLSGFKKAPVSSYTETLTFRGKMLPVSITRYIFTEDITEKITFTEKQAKLLACCSLMKKEMQIMKNSTTESKTISTEITDGTVNIKGLYTNLEKTGTERFFEISVEE